MSRDERWLNPALRHGVEARIGDGDSQERVTVSLDEGGQVQWGPVGQAPAQGTGPHRFAFWVHANSDSERLDAIQILGAKLEAAGPSYEVVPVSPGSQR